MRAVGEVVVVLACAHTAFRAFRTFTTPGRLEVEAGWNFSSGLVLAAAGWLAIVLGGRRPADCGIHARDGVGSVRAALVATAVLGAAGLLAAAAGVDPRSAALGPVTGPLACAAGVLATVVTLIVLARAAPRLARVPPAATLALLGALLLLPAALAITRGSAAGPVLIATTWRFACAGFGEEIFFRGYAQTRLDRAFGRPWRLLDVAFGPGLVIAAVLFGAVHVLNPFDTFTGSGSLAWWHGIATAGMPYGFLFARSGSVIAPAVLHGLVNVLALAAGGS
jgi:membrane protease YdiL (CAAX protease family)